MDPGTFQEINLWYGAYITGFDIDKQNLPGDGVIVGYGEVEGRPAFIWAQDATVLNGTMAEIHTRKIVTVMEKALIERVPIIGIYDSEGIRIQNEVNWHSSFTLQTMVRFQTISSGVIPQISLVMGPCTGNAAISAGISDFLFMVENSSYMHAFPFLSDMVGRETGNAKMHSKNSGCCDVLAQNDKDCLKKCKELLRFLPSHNKEKPPSIDTDDDPNRKNEALLEIVPAQERRGFDMRKVIKQVVDNGYYFEIKKDYAPNLTVGFARLNGQTVGIIANNSIWIGGCLDTNAADKHTRFTRFADAFNLPLIYFTDTPAFFPSIEEERKGILRHGSAVIHANSEATVPQITIYVRKCVGGGQLAMPSNVTKADRDMAWPTVKRAAMGAEAMVSFVYKRYISEAESTEEAAKRRDEKIKVMEDAIERYTRVCNQDFIDPRETRPFLIKALKVLANKEVNRPWRKHENINL
jgi:acetyl-CoA carboxylase carboxyltransferase component